MSETPEEPLPTDCEDPLEELRASYRYAQNRARYRHEHGLTVETEYRGIIEAVEKICGPMLDWQRFWIYAAASGRGVEWTQARRGARGHYHLVGLPCTICGGSGSLGMYRD